MEQGSKRHIHNFFSFTARWREPSQWKVPYCIELPRAARSVRAIPFSFCQHAAKSACSCNDERTHCTNVPLCRYLTSYGTKVIKAVYARSYILVAHIWQTSPVCPLWHSHFVLCLSAAHPPRKAGRTIRPRFYISSRKCTELFSNMWGPAQYIDTVHTCTCNKRNSAEPLKCHHCSKPKSFTVPSAAAYSLIFQHTSSDMSWCLTLSPAQAVCATDLKVFARTRQIWCTTQLSWRGRAAVSFVRSRHRCLCNVAAHLSWRSTLEKVVTLLARA